MEKNKPSKGHQEGWEGLADRPGGGEGTRCPGDENGGQRLQHMQRPCCEWKTGTVEEESGCRALGLLEGFWVSL